MVPGERDSGVPGLRDTDGDHGFFPANVYGGMSAIKGLAAVFGGVKFLPTGGVNAGNLGEFASEPCIFAIGGSWVCTKKNIREHNFERITELSREAVGIIAAARK